MDTLDTMLVSPIAPVLKQRNALFDSAFYDVNKLTEKEKNQLSPLADREGAVIYVPPGESGLEISHFANMNEFLAQHFQNVQAVVVAGVGSSVIGTAALARNVANVYGIPVAGVVSGYGAADLISEAFGGWFFYGATDAIKQKMRESMNAWWDIFRLPENANTKLQTQANSKYLGKDIEALFSLLDKSPPNLSLLVGHSKGDLLLDYALERFALQQNGKSHKYFDALNIATFGAVSDMPREFNKVFQFLGAIDWFGGSNSRFDIPHIMVPNAWHHLNTDLPYHLSVEQVLRENIAL
jgi:hypothetical protein